MQHISDILRFRRMMAPSILEVLFWAAVAGNLYGSHWLFIRGNWAWWMALVFGTLAIRAIFEFALLAFRSYDRLVEISDVLQGTPRS